jgi:hypothetical protein
MNHLFGLFTYSGAQKQTQESHALEAISIHQSEKIRELEQKRREIDQELQDAYKTLRMSQSRENSVEPSSSRASSRPAVSTAATLEAAPENNSTNLDDALWAGMSKVRELEGQLQIFIVSPLQFMMRIILTKIEQVR